MTAFSLVMLGKLVLLVVFVYFFAVVASLCLNLAVFLSFSFFLSFTSSNEYYMLVGQSYFILEGRKVALAGDFTIWVKPSSPKKSVAFRSILKSHSTRLSA